MGAETPSAGVIEDPKKILLRVWDTRFSGDKGMIVYSFLKIKNITLLDLSESHNIIVKIEPVVSND